MQVWRSLVDERAFSAAVASVERGVAPDVVRIRYDFGTDWAGEPAVFFRIVLSDGAMSGKEVLRLTRRIAGSIETHVAPVERYGMFPYFSFRSQSEVTQEPEPAWA